MTCSYCEGGIEVGEKYYLFGERSLCSECARELFPRELADFLDCYSIQDFFAMLDATVREA